MISHFRDGRCAGFHCRSLRLQRQYGAESPAEISRAAVAEFVKAANPEDEFALVVFNDRAQLAVGFSQQAEELQSRLMYVQSRGRTALLDAIYLAMDQMKHAKHSRKAILIISDGEE